MCRRDRVDRSIVNRSDCDCNCVDINQSSARTGAALITGGDINRVASGEVCITPIHEIVECVIDICLSSAEGHDSILIAVNSRREG